MLGLVIILILSIFSVQCLKFDEKIIGGTKINIIETPYQIVLLYSGEFLCGGSIISENWIVSAAHCVVGFDKSKYSVRFGSDFHDKCNDEKPCVIKAIEVIPHPKYNRKTMVNDISMIKLAKSLDFSLPGVKPISLAEKDDKRPEMAYVSGWGKTKENNKKPSSTLQGVQVKVFKPETCKREVAKNLFKNVYMLCAGRLTGGKDSCQGDSGGPMVNLEKTKLFGIVSFGIGCGRRNEPGVYTKVTYFLPFIKKHLNQK